jgi:hypothetical protein
MKAPSSRRNKLVRTVLSTTFLALVVGLAQAASYSSAPLNNDLKGGSCISNCGPGSDRTYLTITDESPWMSFGSTSNPLSSYLLGIDANFNTKYQVESLTFSIKQVEGKSSIETWLFEVGDGVHGGGPTASLQLTNASLLPAIESFTLGANHAVVQTALLPSPDGALQFRLREITVNTSNHKIKAYNASVVVNYADKLVTPVPEPAEWTMLLAGLLVIGFIASRRSHSAS